MIDALISMPTWAGIAVSMVTTAVAGLAVYFVANRLIARYRTDELKDSIGGLFRVIGMLVSLMLSLAFAEVVVGLRSVEGSVQREAQGIVDTFNGLQRIDDDGTRHAQETLIAYARSVVEEEWPALAKDRLAEGTTSLKRKLVDEMMALKPSGSEHEKLWSSVLADVDAVTDARMTRLKAALAQPPVYLHVVFLGFLLTMACFGAYRSEPPAVVLVSLYTMFVGLVLYMILSLSDPFHGGLGVEPAAIERLIEELTARLS